MSTTPLRVSRTASERPRGETEELSLSRRLLEPSTLLLTGVSNIACSEGSLLETRVEELSELQLERVCSVEEAKFPELQFSRGYALDNNKQILIVTQRHLAYHPPFGFFGCPSSSSFCLPCLSPFLDLVVMLQRSRDTQRCYRYCVYTAAARPH